MESVWVCEWSTNGAFVRFLPRMPAHVHHQHVLRLERLLLAAALLPPAHERLLVRMDVIVVDVLHQLVLRGELDAALAPMAVRLDEIARLVLQVGGVDDRLATAAAARRVMAAAAAAAVMHVMHHGVLLLLLELLADRGWELSN